MASIFILSRHLLRDMLGDEPVSPSILSSEAPPRQLLADDDHLRRSRLEQRADQRRLEICSC
ncbi:MULTISPECIES: hypothetical protein [Chromobacteriaceae]|uniref:Uncharacterized protein n=1 Tax=Pseudogulbenkiania ferrooxidans EGD-HP2 TaxID=1388764 RepID=A0ABN0NBP1_9NEIS|nr:MULTISPECIES: hypothetical protein [Chromobacteriaceae]AVG15184.1 hypothetical protein CFN79_04525 [Chromobacterium vaccinii]ERE19905.1 hypothetical protein O166_19570 [Pseudogulbenkiania ferrooxidans EGD-HP2]